MSAIRATSLGYRAGRVTILEGIDLDVEHGELVAVIGPNGAGKSTLLSLLAGDVPPASGVVEISGVDITDLDDGALSRRRSMLGQRRATEVPFTVREVVAMGRHPRRRDPENSATRDAAAVAAALRATDTAALADRVFATLSGGEQARTSLARVFAQQAAVMLLDEPTSALDVAHEEQIMGELAAAAVAGTAIVAVLHDLNVAARHATRIMVVSAGRVVADGAPGAVLTDELLTEVYGQAMRVVPHPFRDCPLVLVAD